MEFYSSYGNQDVVIVNVVVIVTIYYFMNTKNFHPNPKKNLDFLGPHSS